MAPHSSTLAWKIPWMEEPGRLQSMGSLRVGHDWATSLSLSCIGEWNGNPLECSCLENPRDGGAWWAVYGVAQSRARLKWLSHSHILYLCNSFLPFFFLLLLPFTCKNFLGTNSFFHTGIQLTQHHLFKRLSFLNRLAHHHYHKSNIHCDIGLIWGCYLSMIYFLSVSPMSDCLLL